MKRSYRTDVQPMRLAFKISLESTPELFSATAATAAAADYPREKERGTCISPLSYSDWRLTPDTTHNSQTGLHNCYFNKLIFAAFDRREPHG